MTPDSSGLVGCTEKPISSSLFFFQINEFLQEATKFQEEQLIVLLERNHALVHTSDSIELALLYSNLISQYHRPRIQDQDGSLAS